MTTSNEGGAVPAPVVSVVIIFLDAAQFLGEAIESVLAQDYTDWELLLVDDGSTDASAEIATHYAARSPGRIRYLTHPARENRGTAASRNLGAREARGRYVAFLDADDVWLPYKLAQQVEIAASQPRAGLVYGRSERWYSWDGRAQAFDYVPALGVEPDTLIEPPILLTLALESRAPTASLSNILVRRQTLRRIGGFEESMVGRLQLFEDQAFLAKVYLAEPVFVSGAIWDRYRRHDDSCVARTTRAGEKHAVGLAYFDWLERYLVAHQIVDRRLWRALRGKRRRYRHPRAYVVVRGLRSRGAWFRMRLRTLAGRIRRRVAVAR
jgi:glycosyltransferase involved in cell wall biosynthesis